MRDFQSLIKQISALKVQSGLVEKYGLELFGIGASFLGFIMNRVLEVQEVQELGVDLSNLYDTTPEVFEQLLEITTEKGYLFLKYVEYLDH
jgi:hypothetical protein